MIGSVRGDEPVLLELDLPTAGGELSEQRIADAADLPLRIAIRATLPLVPAVVDAPPPGCSTSFCRLDSGVARSSRTGKSLSVPWKRIV